MLNELFILSKIKEGDIKAFEEVFHRYYSPLCWYAAGIIGQMEVAEEIVEAHPVLRDKPVSAEKKSSPVKLRYYRAL